MRKVVFRVILIFVGLFSTFAAWYEGSEIRSEPWEWGYSAVFSKMIHGEVKTESDLIALDHFVYEAKFKPFFPVLMVLSFLGLFTLIVSYFNKKNAIHMMLYFCVIGVILLILSLLLSSSPTVGLTFFSRLFLGMGSVSIGWAVILWIRYVKGKKEVLNEV